MRDALDGAPRGVCATCGGEIALVDQTINLKKRTAKGGKWVHVLLPDNVHPSRPKK